MERRNEWRFGLAGRRFAVRRGRSPDGDVRLASDRAWTFIRGSLRLADAGALRVLTEAAQTPASPWGALSREALLRDLEDAVRLGAVVFCELASPATVALNVQQQPSHEPLVMTARRRPQAYQTRPEPAPAAVEECIDAPADTPVAPAACEPAPVEEKTWFEVRLLDHDGAVLDGVELGFESSMKTASGVTDGDGICRIDGMPARTSFGSFWVKSEDNLRKRLRDGWGKEGYRAPQVTEHERVVPVTSQIGKLLMVSQERTVIRLTPNVKRVRLVGMHFDSAKCFLLPSAMHGIRKVREIYQRYPQAELVITGHTDTKHKGSESEGAKYNQQLSEERAEGVRAYLADDADAWLGWYGYGRTPSWEKQWGSTEDGYMLSVLPSAGTPYKADGVSRWSALVAFQKAKQISASGEANQTTRRALIADYMDLDTTELTQDFPGIVMKTVGYGSQHLAVPTGPNQDEPGNRRVEIFVIDGPAPESPSYEVLDALAGESYDFSTEDAGMRFFDVRFYAPNGKALKDTWFKVNGGVPERVDTEGWGQIEVPAEGCVSVTIEFGAPSELGPFLYTTQVAVNCDEGDDNTQAYAKLHNLGYSGIPELEARVKAFQKDYGIAGEDGLDASGNVPPLTKDKLWAQFDRDTPEP